MAFRSGEVLGLGGEGGFLVKRSRIVWQRGQGSSVDGVLWKPRGSLRLLDECCLLEC